MLDLEGEGEVEGVFAISDSIEELMLTDTTTCTILLLAKKYKRDRLDKGCPGTHEIGEHGQLDDTDRHEDQRKGRETKKSG